MAPDKSSEDGVFDSDGTDVGMKAELRIWQRRYKRDGKQENVLVEALGEPKGFNAPYAVVVNQIFTERHRLESTRLTINSPYILEAFRNVIRSYPVVAADFTEPFDMESPFRMLYHYWDDLEAFKESSEDDEARMHLNLLLDFMETDMGHEKRQIETQIRNGQIDYNRLWTIYRPGDIQVNYQHGHPWLLVVQKTAYEESKKIGKYMEVQCLYTDYNGIAVGQARKVFLIRQKINFAAENPANIQDLPVYPRKFLEEGSSLEQRLKKRGSHFMTLQGVCIRQYDGLADYLKEPDVDYYHPEMAEWDPVWLPYTETGRIVIDRKTFQEDNNLARVVVHSEPKAIKSVLCPPFVYGFSLSRKEWCRFYLNCLHEVEWNQNSFDTLILKESQKILLRALVTSHVFPANSRDQIQQKGKGLVVLLHGTPGSGKTLTAECSAEITERALFVTSMAELNKLNRPSWFEYQLKRVLQYATIWKAVVLFDEADVFLEARTDEGSAATERNSLVAIFLRHLEYFSGIVFLTTNRVEVFDTAMKSRVHLALRYRSPEVEMRRLIWRQALDSLADDQRDIDIGDAVEGLVEEDLNGREISNTINTARTLARFEHEPLRMGHIESVLTVRNEFDRDVKRMRSLAVAAGSKHGATSFAPRSSLLGPMSEEPEELTS